MNYLAIARRVVTDDEKNERDEKGSKHPALVPVMSVPPSVAEGECAGRSVYRDPVEATTPRDWDGTLPAARELGSPETRDEPDAAIVETAKRIAKLTTDELRELRAEI